MLYPPHYNLIITICVNKNIHACEFPVKWLLAPVKTQDLVSSHDIRGHQSSVFIVSDVFKKKQYLLLLLRKPFIYGLWAVFRFSKGISTLWYFSLLRRPILGMVMVS